MATFTWGTSTQIKNIKQGEFLVRKPDAKTVYIRGQYDRSSKSYSCIAFDDMNKEIFIKASKTVFVGFTF